jgi:gliding motility-associated lipoprotein GldD
MRHPKNVFWFLIGLLSLSSCEENYLPKPKGFNRIVLPEVAYAPAVLTGYPYQFEVNTLAEISEDDAVYSEPFWLDISYPEWEANIQVTYKPIQGQEERLKSYLNDAYKLTSKHQIRASAIEESIVDLGGGKVGVIAELEGEVPSQFQFFQTDSTRHFLRAALYFNTATENDSLAPIIEYLKQDMMHMLSTLRWEE